MAKRTTVTLVDDLDGTEIADGGETVAFSLDGVSYEIDLSGKNATKLRKALEPYVSAGRRQSRFGSASRSTSVKKRDLTTIRTWLREQGDEVSDRGRIPTNLIEKYDAAH